MILFWTRLSKGYQEDEPAKKKKIASIYRVSKFWTPEKTKQKNKILLKASDRVNFKC